MDIAVRSVNTIGLDRQWKELALYEMCRRVWETLSDNVIDHAGLTQTECSCDEERLCCTKPTMVENALWKVRTCEALTQLGCNVLDTITMFRHA